MPTHTSTQMDKLSGRPARLLLGLTGALLALLILNLAVFDDLRIDPSGGVLETFVKPQHLSSLLAVLIAGALIAFKHRSAARVAVGVAWIEISAFAFFRVTRVGVGPPKPYWGDGMGDALQWVGLLSILAVSAAIVRLGRRSSKVAVTPAAASLRSWSRPKNSPSDAAVAPSSPMSRSAASRAPSRASSAPTAPARPQRCGCSSACPCPTAGRPCCSASATAICRIPGGAS